jgi:hypothetical protein
MTKAHILEKDVKKGVKMILTKHNWFWWMPPSNAFGRTGISDFHALKAHVFMAIETKVGKKEPTPMQKGFLIDMFLTAFGNSVELSRAGQPEDPDTAALMLNCMRQLQWEVA